MSRQTEPYYSLHRGYIHRYRNRRARALGIPATQLAAWYAVMHDIGSNASQFGYFTTDVRAFEEAIGEPPRFGVDDANRKLDAAAADVWRKRELAKVFRIISGDPGALDDDTGLPSEFRVEVLGVADVNRPRKTAMTGAERVAKHRERLRKECNDETGAALQGVTRNGESLQALQTLQNTPKSSQIPDECNECNESNAEPPNHPTTQPYKESKEPPPKPPSTINTNKTGEGDNTPTDFSKRKTAADELTRIQKKLGTQTQPIQELIENRNSTRQKRMSIFEELQYFWRPAHNLVNEFGMPTARDAITQSVKANATSMNYTKKVCENESTQPSTTNDDLSWLDDWSA